MIAARTGDFSSFHPFMDYNAQIWHNDLDSLIDDLNTDSVSFLPLKWTSDYDGTTTFYSVIFKVCGYVHLEMVGKHVSDANLEQFQDWDKPRVFWNERSYMAMRTADASYQTPIAVSRATGNLTWVK